jgi:beta-lactamase class A
VNRKGKKSSLTRAKGVKVNPQSKPNFIGNSATAKKSIESKPRRVKKKAIAEGVTASIAQRGGRPIAETNSRSNKNLTTKSVSHHRRPKKNIRRQTTTSKTLKLATYIIIITIGLSTIFGSLISIANSFQATQPPDVRVTNTKVKAKVNHENKAKLDSLFAIASLGKEITVLQSQLEQLASQYPDLQPEMFFVDLDTKGFVSIDSKLTLPAASTIKLPILVALFQDIDRGKTNLAEELIMTKDVIAGGSGGMQFEPVNSKFSVLEIAEQMMTISDNTATNMLIKRLGGMEQLNQRFTKMGLATTKLHNSLPDLTGTNTTSSADLGNLLVKIDGGKLISLRSRDRMLYIMRNAITDTLLPEGLESGAIIAHKTGDIKSTLGDVGIIDMPSGKRYIASVLVKRPDNSPLAKEFIQKASGTAYQYFKKPQITSFSLKEN